MRILLPLLLSALVACAPAAPPAGDAAPDAETASAAEAATPAEDPAAPAPSPDDGAIQVADADVARLSGRVSYPSEELPAMRVCALATEDLGLGYCVETAVNAPHYELRVPPGTWIVMAWPQGTGTAGEPGLISQASECLATNGLNCDDHGFFEITVGAGEVREGLDVNDWYYPPEAPPLPMEPRGETLAPMPQE